MSGKLGFTRMKMDKSGLLIGTDQDIIKEIDEKTVARGRRVKKIIERFILSVIGFVTFLLTFGLIYLCSNWD